MVKTYQNLGFFNRNIFSSLSICENRKNNLAVVYRTAEDYNLRSVPKRIGQCRKAGSIKRGHRKSSSLTNGMNPAETKSSLEIMALRPEVLSVFNFVNASVLDTSAEAPSMVARRMS
jgi:hypothetical protein